MNATTKYESRLKPVPAMPVPPVAVISEVVVPPGVKPAPVTHESASIGPVEASLAAPVAVGPALVSNEPSGAVSQPPKAHHERIKEHQSAKKKKFEKENEPRRQTTILLPDSVFDGINLMKSRSRSLQRITGRKSKVSNEAIFRVGYEIASNCTDEEYFKYFGVNQ